VRAIGLDFGLRRVGVAVSDASQTLARPLRTLQRSPSLKEAVSQVAGLVEGIAAEEDGADVVVIGLPRRLDGSPTDQTVHVQHFVDALRSRITLPIVLQDERLSSHEAEGRLAVNERDWRVRKAKLDAAAAAVILQDYLDGRPRAGSLAADDE
jgi:putative holliday junction resolvase